MDDVRQHYATWLRNTHAMEEQAIAMLNGQLQRLENYPDLSERIRQHLVETEGQAAALKEILESRDLANSMVKDAMGKVMATGQAVSGLFVDDEVIKGSMASYAFEHVEIAAYQTLIAAAEYLGDSSALPIYRRILDEEIAMADWLSQHLAPTVAMFLAREAADLQAKR